MSQSLPHAAPHGPAPAPAEIDAALLDRLAAVIGERALDELLADAALALADRRRLLVDTLDAPGTGAAGDPAALARLGHDLAAMAGQIGLAALSAAARDLDGIARAEASGAVAERALAAAGRRTLAALERGIRALAAYRDRRRHGIASADNGK